LSVASGQSQVDQVKQTLANMALKSLLYQMSGISQAWWFQGATVQKNPDGSYFLLAQINPKVPLDDTGWPYGLPQAVGGVTVKSSRSLVG
jgi:hypothetical protein